MTDCSRIQSMVEPFLNEELNSADRDEFITHVRNCKACRDELEVFHVVYSVISQLDNDTADPVTDYSASLQKLLEKQEVDVKVHKLFLYVTEIVLAVAILIVTALLIYL